MRAAGLPSHRAAHPNAVRSLLRPPAREARASESGRCGSAPASAAASCERELISSLRYTLVRCTSTVLWVMNSAWAISRLVGPWAAISATRRSLGVSDSTPLSGDAPRPGAGGEQLGLGAGGERRGAADRRELDRAPKLVSRAWTRWPALRSAAPSSVRALACSSFAGESLSTSTASPSSARPRIAALDQSRRAEGRAERARARPRRAPARALRAPADAPGPASPSWRSASAAGERQGMNAGLRCRPSRTDDPPRAAPRGRRPDRHAGSENARGCRGDRASERSRAATRPDPGDPAQRPLRRAFPAPSASRRERRWRARRSGPRQPSRRHRPGPRGRRLPPRPGRLARRASGRETPSPRPTRTSTRAGVPRRAVPRR